jgi:hypothetical protein
MDYLRRLAEGYGLREIADRALERKDVQGIVVDINSFWLDAWIAHQAGLDDRWEDWVTRWGHFACSPPFFPELEALSTAGRLDLNWKPRQWEMISHRLGLRSPDLPPLEVKICLIPGSEPSENLVFQDTRLTVRLETRPLARLASDPKAHARPLLGGVSIGAAPSLAGTLGGILRDASGKSFALTCDHVLANQSVVYQPAQLDSSSASRVGTVITTSGLQPVTRGGICNPYNPAVAVNDFDIALVELDQNILTPEVLDIGPLHGRTPKISMAPSLAVEFTGRSSGHRSLIVGGLAVAYSFRNSSGQSVCFRNLFELKWPRFSRLVLGRPVKSGDSGAWVCTQGASGTEWCGVIMGEDRLHGFAMLSESIEGWLAGHGYNLSCV